MPELPEVETVRRGLLRVLPGVQVTDVDVRLQRCFVGEPDWLKERYVQDVQRRGKALLLHLDEELVALVHLRMTGQLIYLPPDQGPREGGGHPSDALIQDLPNVHTRVILSLDDGGTLFFNDQRTFGSIKLIDQTFLDQEPFLAKLGPEPWARTFSIKRLHETFRRRARSSVKAILLDQEVVAGIGNIYADEALFLFKEGLIDQLDRSKGTLIIEEERPSIIE